MSEFFESRDWMYKRRKRADNSVSKIFSDGLNTFISFACSQASYLETGELFCPCKRCKNQKPHNVNTVTTHLMMKGFMENYYVWTQHGENCYYAGEASTSHPVTEQEEEAWTGYPDTAAPIDQLHDPPGHLNMLPEGGEVFQEPIYEEYQDPVQQALEAANQPLYDGCADGISQLYLTSKQMTWKTNYNIPEECLDDIAQTFNYVLPSPNTAPKSYYETKKLTKSLGLPCHKIDVCEENCMLFWKGEDSELSHCRFCGKDRYEPIVGRSGKKIPKQRMFYLPLGDRLKRLYQSNTTASQMRWHAEHVSPEGEMHHPSDGKAWKHFQEVYPSFASESRNVYLGLSTDGFNPIGMNGQSYSVWPVIVTPYNLPPGMCMKREYFFLSILVPGPKHPKKSLDIYLQPLIEELKDLWSEGVQAYDVSRKETFTMRAALMWTISDFPAYNMLSGWMTHGRLACPYCMDETKSFWLPNGRKHSWFDCHRRFLPPEHPYRRNVRAFLKGKAVRDDPPPLLNGEEILHERMNNINGLHKTVICGGNGHNNPSRTIESYGVHHNWVKKSIFWELPYWEQLLLRHNLDFMHIEKNFFDNLINTILNVPGKTKDSVKSRLDLASLCRRPDLEVTPDGNVPIPIFRLSKEGKGKFLRWLKEDIKFPDGTTPDHRSYGYFRYCTFFRDISTKVLRTEDVAILKENIAVRLCNLERIFPPAFFDVMEHLPVHLPDEADLGGPVQYRWMYPFERYMYHLKKKVKNKARIGGSIVAQCVIEEISHVASNYITPPEDSAEDVHEIRFIYNYPDVPIMFQQVGRIGGRLTTRWLDDEDHKVLQTFLLLNCQAFEPYERMYEEEIRNDMPDISPDALTRLKDANFSTWCKKYVNDASILFEFPLWFLEFVQGPMHKITSWPMYFSRGYHYQTQNHGQNRKTMNYGVAVHGTTELEYFGLIDEIFMIEYSGAVGLKLMIFKCQWFNTTRGIRKHPSGIVDVCPQLHYEKYDPFILPEQCDQVCYIPYPRIRPTREEWWATTRVMPRGYTQTQEVAQIAVQNDYVDHEIQDTAILRVEAHAVQDAFDYDPTPTTNPNDEYDSENETDDQYSEYSDSDSCSDD